MKTNIALYAIIGFIAATLVWSVYSFSKKSVTISEKQFSCTATEPFGIEARCTQYTWTKGAR